MKYRSFKELRSDKNITPEDVAQFALYEREMNDIDKFKAICDLIVCCEKVSVTQLEAQNKELIEVLENVQSALKMIKIIVNDNDHEALVYAQEIIYEALHENDAEQALKEDKQDG